MNAARSLYPLTLRSRSRSARGHGREPGGCPPVRLGLRRPDALSPPLAEHRSHCPACPPRRARSSGIPDARARRRPGVAMDHVEEAGRDAADMAAEVGQGVEVRLIQIHQHMLLQPARSSREPVGQSGGCITLGPVHRWLAVARTQRQGTDLYLARARAAAALGRVGGGLLEAARRAPDDVAVTDGAGALGGEIGLRHEVLALRDLLHVLGAHLRRVAGLGRRLGAGADFARCVDQSRLAQFGPQRRLAFAEGGQGVGMRPHAFVRVGGAGRIAVIALAQGIGAGSRDAHLRLEEAVAPRLAGIGQFVLRRFERRTVGARIGKRGLCRLIFGDCGAECLPGRLRLGRRSLDRHADEMG
ncbi:MAG: hypothetical protein MZV63_40190 [Marinilabiliales bacterium]|nr:hypothetical protein [Marinilabiliales bacterium]